MPLKRKEIDGHDQQLTGQQKKKQRSEAVRTIAIQSIPPDAASPGLIDSSSKKGMEGLPSSIDVEKFAESRAFEINAMQDAMKKANNGSNHRVWQTLPRHLRRRAASHDVRRVPAKLRDKARAEMDTVRKKILGRSMPKRGKGKQTSRSEELLRRQRDKKWLETHIWHAKRMKMQNLWGYRLAIHSTEKAFRPSHRASLHGSILHDASYDAIIELKGPEPVLKTILNSCCDPQGAGPGAVRFTNGARVCNTHLYKPGSYPFDLVGPITIIWQSCEPPMSTGTLSTSTKGKKIPVAQKESKINATTSKPIHRRLWIRCHPLAYQSVFSAIQEAASISLEAIRQNSGNDESKVELEFADLRGHMNIFEIMGPKSNQVIKGALTPTKEEERQEFQQFWSSLTDLQSSGTVPRGMIVGFKVYDPRLNFPPKNAKPRINKHDDIGLAPPSGLWPTSKLASSAVWDEKVRYNLSKPRYKKKDMDERRSKYLIPGSKLKPLRQDDRIPVLLIQRSLEAHPYYDQIDPGIESRAIHGWTLIFPKGWGMPFLSSLLYTGTRIGGQRERETQHFEAGSLAFPRDYPFTPGYVRFANEREQDKHERWERKPPAKRPSWAKLGTISPWKPDWNGVMGLKTSCQTGLIPTQREPLSEDDNDSGIRPWLLRGPETKSLLENVYKSPEQQVSLMTQINKLRVKRQSQDLTNGVDVLMRGAWVMVDIRFAARASPEDCAIIYRLSDDEARKWCISLRKGEDSMQDTELCKLTPSHEDIVGYITSGDYSLSLGKGHGIGAISLSRVADLRSQACRLGSHAFLVKVRNQDGTVCRAAHVSVLS